MALMKSDCWNHVIQSGDYRSVKFVIDNAPQAYLESQLNDELLDTLICTDNCQKDVFDLILSRTSVECPNALYMTVIQESQHPYMLDAFAQQFNLDFNFVCPERNLNFIETAVDEESVKIVAYLIKQGMKANEYCVVQSCASGISDLYSMCIRSYKTHNRDKKIDNEHFVLASLIDSETTVKTMKTY